MPQTNPSHYRVTRPEKYLSPGCPGHTNPAARQGYYADATSPLDAARLVAERLIAAKEFGSGYPDTAYDVQRWDDTEHAREAIRVRL